MKSMYALVAATSLGFLAACGDGLGQTARAPTQAEEIAEFCNQIASDFAANPAAGPNQFLGQMNRKILEKEWNPETVANACSAALSRKTEFIRENNQAILNGVR